MASTGKWSSTVFSIFEKLLPKIVGFGVRCGPSCFRWELVEWKPLEQQSRAEIEGKSAEVFGEIHEVGEDTSEEGKIELDLGTGDVPVHEIGDGGPIFEDYLGDLFEKVGEFDLEEDPKTPSEPIPSISSIETLTKDEPREKRVKTLVGRTDLPWVQQLLAQQSKTSPSSRQTSTHTK